MSVQLGEIDDDDDDANGTKWVINFVSQIMRLRMRRPFSTQTDDPLEAMLLKFVRVLHGLKVKHKKVLEIFTNSCRFSKYYFCSI